MTDYRLHSSFERGALESVEGLGSREPLLGGGRGLGALSPEQRAHRAQLAHAHAALLSSPPPGDAFRRHTVHVTVTLNPDARFGNPGSSLEL